MGFQPSTYEPRRGYYPDTRLGAATPRDSCDEGVCPESKVNTAMGWNRAAFNRARDLVGVERLVFGTNYFIPGGRFTERTIEFLDG